MITPMPVEERIETLADTLERGRLQFQLRRTERALAALRDRLSHYEPGPAPLGLHAAIRDFDAERRALRARLALL